MSRQPDSIIVRPGQEPSASPAARWVGVATGLTLLALAFAAGRELWVRLVDHQLASWARPVTHWVGTITYQQWMLYAGIAAIVVGLGFLAIVFAPRTKTHRRLVDSSNNVWMRPVDIARMTTAAAENVAGVRHATTRVKASQVLVDIDGDHTDPTLAARVGRTLGPLVAQVAGSPELLVKITTEQEDQA